MIEPWHNVRDPDYFRGILGNMVRLDSGARNSPSTIVRLGIGGQGKWPNYQVETATRVRAFMGSSHKPDPRAAGGRYAEAELSARHFSFRDIQQLLEACMTRIAA
jgi:hypothetical protein